MNYKKEIQEILDDIQSKLELSDEELTITLQVLNITPELLSEQLIAGLKLGVSIEEQVRLCKQLF